MIMKTYEKPLPDSAGPFAGFIVRINEQEGEDRHVDLEVLTPAPDSKSLGKVSWDLEEHAIVDLARWFGEHQADKSVALSKSILEFVFGGRREPEAPLPMPPSPPTRTGPSVPGPNVLTGTPAMTAEMMGATVAVTGAEAPTTKETPAAKAETEPAPEDPKPAA